MRGLLRRIPYSVLLVMAIFLGVAPITPQPHLIEKLALLLQGRLVRLIDIFDLLFHSAPLMILALKLILERKPGQESDP